MSGRAKAWLVGGWAVLVVGGWAFTESINDGIEPTSGPQPKPSSTSTSWACSGTTPAPTSTPTPTRMPTLTPMPVPPSGVGPSDIADYYVESDLVVTAVACKVAD
ncbi:hypothetical protein ACQEV2_19475 [Streptomyces sp. CA-251387]|uniref:hypothetical protein n=1 Tax=Streptomyces sp. CA-251387 TaxID=3240064 RepID=UPI003D8DE02B